MCVMRILVTYEYFQWDYNLLKTRTFVYNFSFRIYRSQFVDMQPNLLTSFPCPQDRNRRSKCSKRDSRNFQACSFIGPFFLVLLSWRNSSEVQHKGDLSCSFLKCSCYGIWGHWLLSAPRKFSFVILLRCENLLS